MSLTVSFLIGTLAYVICSVIGSHLWHVVLFEDAFLSLKAWTRFDDRLIPAEVAAHVLQGLLVSHMLPLYLRARGGGEIAGGASFGLWVSTATKDARCRTRQGLRESVHDVTLSFPAWRLCVLHRLSIHRRNQSGRVVRPVAERCNSREPDP